MLCSCGNLRYIFISLDFFTPESEIRRCSLIPFDHNKKDRSFDRSRGKTPFDRSSIMTLEVPFDRSSDQAKNVKTPFDRSIRSIVRMPWYCAFVSKSFHRNPESVFLFLLRVIFLCQCPRSESNSRRLQASLLSSNRRCDEQQYGQL